MVNYYDIFVEFTEKAISKINIEEDLETTDLLSRFTLDVLGRTVFNHDFGRIDGKNDKYYMAYRKYLETGRSYMLVLFSMFPALENLPIKRVKDYQDSLDILLQFFQEMIEQHKDTTNDNSILSKMLNSTESPDKKPLLSRAELIANIWLFFVAGHETTATAISMELNCLRAYPEIQQKVYQEIIDKIGHDKIPTESDLRQLTYLDCFINEVLRLHTPVPLIETRIAGEDIQYNNMNITKGTRMGIFFQVLHTNPDIWEDPFVFKPERFLPENRKGMNNFVHVPFSAGTRQCIGMGFTLIEQRLFLTRLLQKYEVVNPVQKKVFGTDQYPLLGKEYSVPVFLKKRLN